MLPVSSPVLVFVMGHSFLPARRHRRGQPGTRSSAPHARRSRSLHDGLANGCCFAFGALGGGYRPPVCTTRMPNMPSATGHRSATDVRATFRGLDSDACSHVPGGYPRLGLAPLSVELRWDPRV